MATTITINISGVKTYYLVSEKDVNKEYDGAILGTFTSDLQNLSISSWQFVTFSQPTRSCYGAHLYYLLYEEGNRPSSPTFNELVGHVVSTTGPQQVWGQSASTN